MTKEWLLVYQVRWYAWVFLSLYAVIVELFMTILGLGGLGYGVAALLGLVSMSIAETSPAWQSYGIFILEMLFAAWLGWSGLRGAGAELLAIFTSPRIFEGTLDQLSVEVRQTKNGSYGIWVLKFANKTWEIAKRDVDRTPFRTQVTVGSDVRIQYRRGALVHKSNSRRNPFVGSEKLCHFVTLGHTQMRHFVESGTANQCLRCLRFKQTRREVVAEDGF